ncbi:MAG: PHP domain-containing protein [Desulfobulbaceae bacterium]|jgi:predicted metal-dependent phosphoesterase TrpH|nr:PHP domain-containing protein [Desulfobulbaceae bacterium]
MSVDLHIHSHCSDGTDSPAEIVRLAKGRGLIHIAITDHDCAEGVPEALAAGLAQGVRVTSGIEVSVRHDGVPVHVLGYGFTLDHPEMAVFMATLQKERKERNQAILAKLAECRLTVSLDDVRREAGIGQIGRPHFAKTLVKKGYAPSHDEAFRQYLGRGAKAYAPRPVHSAEEAITMIHKAGGLASLAHPANIDPSLQKISALVAELTALGLDGLEAHYPTHTKAIRAKLLEIAKENQLIATGGSDYHGAIRPEAKLAGSRRFRVPTEVSRALLASLAAASRRSEADLAAK